MLWWDEEQGLEWPGVSHIKSGPNSVSERTIFLNGEYVLESAARISVFDRVVSAGDGIYDVARTFGHKPNKLRAHCERLCRSALYTRIALQYSAEELEAIGVEVLRRNLLGIDKRDDRILWYVVTRGQEIATRNPIDATTPTVIVYTVPPNYHRFSKFYRIGAHLITAATRRTPTECLDPRAKITNKMNHIMAEIEAKAADREAIALMLGTDGLVAEASYANVFFVKDGRLCTPRSKNILLGIMRENVIEIAPKANIELVEGDFFPYDFLLADEIFLTTTSFSILPIGRFNGKSLAEVPGPVTSRLMNAWSREIGVDFVAQAETLSEVATARA
jgi:branched-chain amino acid aminotransferase